METKEATDAKVYKMYCADPALGRLGISVRSPDGKELGPWMSRDAAIRAAICHSVRYGGSVRPEIDEIYFGTPTRVKWFDRTPEELERETEQVREEVRQALRTNRYMNQEMFDALAPRRSDFQ